MTARVRRARPRPDPGVHGRPGPGGPHPACGARPPRRRFRVLQPGSPRPGRGAGRGHGHVRPRLCEVPALRATRHRHPAGVRGNAGRREHGRVRRCRLRVAGRRVGPAPGMDRPQAPPCGPGPDRPDAARRRQVEGRSRWCPPTGSASRRPSRWTRSAGGTRRTRRASSATSGGSRRPTRNRRTSPGAVAGSCSRWSPACPWWSWSPARSSTANPAAPGSQPTPSRSWSTTSSPRPCEH